MVGSAIATAVLSDVYTGPVSGPVLSDTMAEYTRSTS